MAITFLGQSRGRRQRGTHGAHPLYGYGARILTFGDMTGSPLLGLIVVEVILAISGRASGSGTQG